MTSKEAKQLLRTCGEDSVKVPAKPASKRRRRPGVILLLMLLILFASWFGLFSLPNFRTHHWSPRYVLWKHGLFPRPPNDILFSAFYQDRGRDSIVVGLTADELERKFGPIRRPGNLLWYQQHYIPLLAADGDYAWLGDTQFMVEFKNGRVVSLTLAKG